jgi:hypothetical protein
MLVMCARYAFIAFFLDLMFLPNADRNNNMTEKLRTANELKLVFKKSSPILKFHITSTTKHMNNARFRLCLKLNMLFFHILQ